MFLLDIVFKINLFYHFITTYFTGGTPEHSIKRANPAAPPPPPQQSLSYKPPITERVPSPPTVAATGGSITTVGSMGDFSHYNSKLTVDDFDLLKVRYLFFRDF